MEPPRFTGDLDIVIRPTAANWTRVIAAIEEFGFPVKALDEAYLVEKHPIPQLGVPPVQVHIMSVISGVDFDTLWNSRQSGSYARVAVCFAGLDTLIANKTASGRPKDLADVAALQHAHSG